MKLVIPLPPVTKKNHGRIITNGNRSYMLPSKPYEDYQKAAGWFLKPLGIDKPVNVKTVFYMPTKRKVDISNLISAAHDVLVHYKVLSDDNSAVIVSVDGSRVEYDKANPRTEIEITEVI